MNEYIAVWDIAKKRDFTTGFIIKRTAEIVAGSELLAAPDRVRIHADIVAIDKFNNMPYTRVAEVIESRMGHKDLAHSCDLLIDGTGVGAAVVDLLRERGLNPVPIVFTGGSSVREVTAPLGSMFHGGNALTPLKIVKELHVPKADLVAAGKLLIEQGRVRVAEGLRWGGDFKNQLLAFKGKVNEKGNRKYEADTEGDHDDMVVCLLMAAWWILRGGSKDTERVIPAKDEPDSWSPSDYY